MSNEQPSIINNGNRLSMKLTWTNSITFKNYKHIIFISYSVKSAYKNLALLLNKHFLKIETCIIKIFEQKYPLIELNELYEIPIREDFVVFYQ